MTIRKSLKQLGILAGTALVAWTMSAGCAAPDQEEEVGTAGGGVPSNTAGDEFGDYSSNEGEEVASTDQALYGCGAYCGNCVLYAKCRKPNLPTGLFTYQDKVRRINSRTPRAGCVAVIPQPHVWGHVAYVRAVSGGRIYIDEGGWNWGSCNQRSGTAAQLRIAGYIC